MSNSINLQELATLIEDFGSCRVVGIYTQIMALAMGGTPHVLLQNDSRNRCRLYMWPEELREGDRIIIENKTVRIERADPK